MFNGSSQCRAGTLNARFMKQNAAQNPNFDGFKEGLAVQYGVV
jgi:hypothetical protein